MIIHRRYIQRNIKSFPRERRSNFANHIIEAGREMKNKDDIMSILHNENNHQKVIN